MKLFKIIPMCLLFITVAFIGCKQSDGDFLKKIQNNGINLPVGVKISVWDKVVYLDGLVESDSISESIEKSLKGVKEIDTIKNNLKIVPALTQQVNTTLDDNLLQSRIISALLADSLNKVGVEVSNGEVKIKGSVSLKDSLKVLNIVNSFEHGSLINELVILDHEMI